jgi:hypothetical protein
VSALWSEAMSTTYTVSVFDYEKICNVIPFKNKLTPREAVKAVRELESLGYDREVSIYVERENEAQGQLF